MSLHGHEPVLDVGRWTIWVAGEPMEGPEGLARALLEGGLEAIAGWPGDWSLVARKVGDARLLVATDAFSGVPLFVREGEACLDPVTAGWAGPIDEVEVRQHLMASFQQPWRTWIEGVWRVPAGHGGWLGGPADLYAIFHPRGQGRSLRGAMESSVQRRYRAGGRVALSGGLDSSVLAGLLAHQGPIEAVSNRFPGWSCDEGRYIRAVCEQHRLPSVAIDSRGPGRVLDLLAPPFFPPVLVNHHLNVALMEPGGVLYTGFGGDEVLGHGFDVVRQRMSQHQPIRAVIEGILLGLRYRHQRASRTHEVGRWLREAGRAALSPSPAKVLRERRIRRFQDALLVRSREEQLRLARLFDTRLVMPFLDVEVVNAVVELDAASRVHFGRTREHVRRAFADLLPYEVASRVDKADLSQSVEAAVQPLLEEAGRALKERRIARFLTVEERRTLNIQIIRKNKVYFPFVWRLVGAYRFLTWHTAP